MSQEMRGFHFPFQAPFPAFLGCPRLLCCRQSGVRHIPGCAETGRAPQQWERGAAPGRKPAGTMNGTPLFQTRRAPACRRGWHVFWPAGSWWPHLPWTAGIQAEDGTKLNTFLPGGWQRAQGGWGDAAEHLEGPFFCWDGPRGPMMLRPIKQPGASFNQGIAPQMSPFQNPGWGREFIGTRRRLALGAEGELPRLRSTTSSASQRRHLEAPLALCTLRAANPLIANNER